jgi:TfoX/Sxy family transcriptional regulator of competence genes
MLSIGQNILKNCQSHISNEQSQVGRPAPVRQLPNTLKLKKIKLFSFAISTTLTNFARWVLTIANHKNIPMAYSEKLADRIRESLSHLPKVEEKKMFRGLTFMVNGKMCVSVSGENLMCRFDPSMQDELAGKKGFKEMVMKGRVYKGYGYINPDGIRSKKDFEFWISLALEFNKHAKAGKKQK